MDKVEKDWSKFAEDFDKRQERIVGKEVMVQLRDEIKKLNNFGYLLEIDCGNGTYTKLIEHAAEKITATDCSAEMVIEAKKKLANNEKIEVQQANCYELEFPDSTFDSVMMANLIHIIAEPQKAIQETVRVLKPNGTLVVTSFTLAGMSFFNKLSMMFKYLKTVGKPPTAATPFSVKSLTEFVQKNGLEVIESKLVGRKSKAIYIIAKKKGN